MRSSINNLLTICLNFFIIITLSTRTTVAMQQDYYKVTVENFLLHSTIKVQRPWQTELYPTYLTPSSSTTFLLSKDNSKFTILLSECYIEPLIQLTSTKNGEIFYISPLRDLPKEKTISINNDTQELGKKTATMNPAKYQIAKKIILKKIQSQ